MDKQKVIDKLVTEFDYSSKGASLVWRQLENLSPLLQNDFARWWDKKIIPNIEVNGYNFRMLMAEHSMNPIAAFLTLDWLIREPEKAKESLKKGHDKVLGN